MCSIIIKLHVKDVSVWLATMKSATTAATGYNGSNNNAILIYFLKRKITQTETFYV